MIIAGVKKIKILCVRKIILCVAMNDNKLKLRNRTVDVNPVQKRPYKKRMKLVLEASVEENEEHNHVQQNKSNTSLEIFGELNGSISEIEDNQQLPENNLNELSEAENESNNDKPGEAENENEINDDSDD